MNKKCYDCTTDSETCTTRDKLINGKKALEDKKQDPTLIKNYVAWMTTRVMDCIYHYNRK